MLILNISVIQKYIRLRFGTTNSINKHYRIKIPYTHNTNFLPLRIITCIPQTKSESEIYIYFQMLIIFHLMCKMVALRILKKFNIFILILHMNVFLYILLIQFKKLFILISRAFNIFFLSFTDLSVIQYFYVC